MGTVTSSPTPTAPARPVRAGGKAAEQDERNIVVKMYAEVDGDGVDTILSQTSDLVSSSSKYAITLLLEEIV